MTSSNDPVQDPRTDQAGRAGRAAADPETLRELADQLHDCITQTFEDWASRDAIRERAPRETQTFSRPVTAPPVRMEQLARAPEPTADLDDLVDLLVPRLVEQLVPALRAALKDDA